MNPAVHPVRKQTCCCCLNLRIGSILAGVYTILLAAISAIALLVVMKMTKSAVKQALEDQDLDADDDIVKSAMSLTAIILWIAFAIFVVWIPMAILLLIGVFKSKRALAMPWLIYTIIVTGISGLGMLQSVINYKTTFSDTTQIGQFVLEIVIIILNIYALWCVATFYKNRMQLDDAAVLVANDYQGVILEPPPSYNASYNDYKYMPEKV